MNNTLLPLWAQKTVEVCRAVLRHKTTQALLVGAILFLVLYVLSYLVLVGQAERRAKAERVNGYYLVFSRSEKYELLACAFYWPIYSLDTGYEDDRLYARCMIPKSMTLRDYARHCKCCLLDCADLN